MKRQLPPKRPYSLNTVAIWSIFMISMLQQVSCKRLRTRPSLAFVHIVIGNRPSTLPRHSYPRPATKQLHRSFTRFTFRDDATELSASTKKKKKKKISSAKKSKKLYRADRVLANRSGMTRTDCFGLLQRKQVSILEKDDDPSKLRTLKGPKEKIPMTARLFVNQDEVPQPPPLLTVYHKPKWVLSTMGADSKGRRNLEGLQFPHAAQLHPVGRLDYDTSGLLLFSSSGSLTQTLLHPKYSKEKEYVATVVGVVQEDDLRQRLQTGVELVDVAKNKAIRRRGGSNQAKNRTSYDYESDDESHNPDKHYFTATAELLDARVFYEPDVPPYLADIRRTLPPEYNVTDLKLRGFLDILGATQLSEVRLVVQEGKHRMVRRMMATCGHPVVSLKRERMGRVELGSLQEGCFRNLTAEEEAWAENLVKDD